MIDPAGDGRRQADGRGLALHEAGPSRGARPGPAIIGAHGRAGPAGRQAPARVGRMGQGRGCRAPGRPGRAAGRRRGYSPGAAWCAAPGTSRHGPPAAAGRAAPRPSRANHRLAGARRAAPARPDARRRRPWRRVGGQPRLLAGDPPGGREGQKGHAGRVDQPRVEREQVGQVRRDERDCARRPAAAGTRARARAWRVHARRRRASAPSRNKPNNVGVWSGLRDAEPNSAASCREIAWLAPMRTARVRPWSRRSALVDMLWVWVNAPGLRPSPPARPGSRWPRGHGKSPSFGKASGWGACCGCGRPRR